MANQGQLSSLMEGAGDVVFQMNRTGHILYASKRSAKAVTHNVPFEGKNIAELVAAADASSFALALSEAVTSTSSVQIVVRMHTPHPAAKWFDWQLTAYINDSGEPELLAIGRDVSKQRVIEERLGRTITHDSLTGLPNRVLLSDRIQMAIAYARRTGSGFSLITLDLDGFKKINDALGHAIGDALLQVTGQRLRDALRDADTLARVSGDEFAAILPGVIDEAEIQMITHRLIATMQLPFHVEEHTLYISTSIGGAIYPEHGDSEVRLLAHADTAMCRAKEMGKARCVVYNVQKFTQPEHDVSMEAAMFDGVRNGEFLLHYQPIVDARTREVVGFEALMRWMHPQFGAIPPMQFIPMAEGNGLINLLGAWALKAACMQLKRFEQAAGKKLYVSVNVSPRQFRNDQFLRVMDDAIELSGLNGDQLLLEITEGILMSDPEYAEVLLTSIATRNVRIAIDDFGTGYSSLAYLKRFPIHALKIDRAFIKDLPASVKDAAICNVVLSLARHLHLSTIAEGVESEAQLGFLATQGCALIQGFHTGGPLLPEQLIGLLKSSLVMPSYSPVVH